MDKVLETLFKKKYMGAKGRNRKSAIEKGKKGLNNSYWKLYKHSQQAKYYI